MNCASVSRPAPPLSAARLIVCDSTAAVWASGNLVWPSRVLAASSLRCALSKSLRCWLKSLAAARSFNARRASGIAESAIARGFFSRLLQNHQIPSPSRMRKITRPICLSRSMEIRYHSMSPETCFFERGTFARSLAGLRGYGDCGRDGMLNVECLNWRDRAPSSDQAERMRPAGWHPPAKKNLPSPLSPGIGNSYTASFFRDSRDRPADLVFSCAPVATHNQSKGWFHTQANCRKLSPSEVDPAGHRGSVHHRLRLCRYGPRRGEPDQATGHACLCRPRERGDHLLPRV